MRNAAAPGIVRPRRVSAGRPARFVTARRTGPMLSPAGRRRAEGGQMAGKFFDEWQVGERIEHEIRRTVTETDNLLFSCLTHNPQPLHLDAEAAQIGRASCRERV